MNRNRQNWSEIPKPVRRLVFFFIEFKFHSRKMPKFILPKMGRAGLIQAGEFQSKIHSNKFCTHFFTIFISSFSLYVRIYIWSINCFYRYNSMPIVTRFVKFCSIFFSYMYCTYIYPCSGYQCLHWKYYGKCTESEGRKLLNFPLYKILRPWWIFFCSHPHQ